MAESQSKAIVPAPVLPLVTPEKAAEQWALFETLKNKLLAEDDYQVIAAKRYIKRSGFRKIAVYFGISDLILKEERVDRDDGSFTWRITVQAVAPNGRSCVGVGACDSRERKFAHTEHDVYSTAHTRAKSRAISDMIAGGAVSAEEMSASDLESASEPMNQPGDKPTDPTQPTKSQTDPQICVPIAKNPLKMEGLRQFPLVDGLKALGMLNVFQDQVSIVPERPLPKDSLTIANFLIPKIIEALCTKNGFTYRVAEENQEVVYILVNGNLTDAQLKELQTGARWALAKAYEKDTEQQKKA